MKDNSDKLRVLILCANPVTTRRLRFDEEVRQIQERVAVAKHDQAVEIISRLAVRWNDLQRILREERPHVVHFSGHGTDHDEILMEDEGGTHRAVPGQGLAEMFGVHGRDVQMVVLNACYSKPQAEAISQHVDCVIGMSRRIRDPAAIAFSAELYLALAYGESVEQAFKSAQIQIKLGGYDDGDVPQLLVKGGADPAQIILVSEPSPPRHPILLHIDLATDNPVPLDDARKLLKDTPERTLHLSKFGVQPTSRGSELKWDRCARAIDKMIAEARTEASTVGRTPQYYVVGRGALPVFAYLGLELAAWADVVLLNQRKDERWDSLRIRRGQMPEGERYFRVRGLEDGKASPAEGRVAVFVSTQFPLKEELLYGFVRAQGESVAGIVEVRTPAPGETPLDASTAARAAHELVQIFGRIPDAYPHQRGLAVFIGGPASLAFLVGRAINPRVFHDVWLPNYDGRAYQPALTFPAPRGKR